MSQDEAGPRHVTVEGSEGSRQQRKEQERAQVLSQVQRSEHVRSKQEKLGRNEMRRHGQRRSEYAGDCDSCVAVIVFAHFRWFVTKSCKSCVDMRARKVRDKLRGVSLWYANPRMTETCEVLVAVSESDMSQMWYHDGCGMKLELESNGIFELSAEIVLGNVRTTSLNSSLSELEQIKDTTITIANSEHLQFLKRARQ